MIYKLINAIVSDRRAQRDAGLYRNLIRHEAKIGGQIFAGEVPKGTRREFFCLDEHTWVWHEEWTNNQGQRQIQTTRYDIRPSGVVKSQNGHYSEVSDTELQRLIAAAQNYLKKVDSQIYAGAIAA